MDYSKIIIFLLKFLELVGFFILFLLRFIKYILKNYLGYIIIIFIIILIYTYLKTFNLIFI